jgi:hypothetical protein
VTVRAPDQDAVRCRRHRDYDQRVETGGPDSKTITGPESPRSCTAICASPTRLSVTWAAASLAPISHQRRIASTCKQQARNLARDLPAPSSRRLRTCSAKPPGPLRDLRPAVCKASVQPTINLRHLSNPKLTGVPCGALRSAFRPERDIVLHRQGPPMTHARKTLIAPN